MSEQLAHVATGMSLCYEELGDAEGAPLLLVMGLGTQMVAWPDEFCAMLGARGFRVIRFDNRDIGRSTKLSDRPVPTTWDVLTRSSRRASYMLGDLAADALGLLDVLEIDSAHVAGVSMGGMIAQTLAARRPERVRSLASVMSTTGGRWVGQPALRIYPLFLKQPAPEMVVEHMVSLFEAIGSPELGIDREELQRVIRLSVERSEGGDQEGTARQLQAILASGDRTAEVRRITAPSVVVHGTADPLIRPSGGRATHRAIAGSEMVWVQGMGHDLPRAAWPRLVDAIARNAGR